MAIEKVQQNRIGLEDIKKFLWFAWLRMLIGAALVLLLAVLYLAKTPTQYTAVASVMYDPVSAPIFARDSSWLESRNEMTTRIDSQVEIIRSERMASSIIKALNLMSDPEFVDPAPMSSGKKLSDEKKLKMGVGVKKLLKRLSVRRAGLSSVINIYFSANNREKATRITNKIADSYIAGSLQDKADTASNGTLWLQERLQELRQQAFDSLRKAEQFEATGSAQRADSAVKLAELKSIASTYRRMYELFLFKLTETSQRVSYPVADAKIVSRASSFSVSIFPKEKLVLAFALVLGSVLGLAVAVAERALDNRIGSTSAIAVTGIACIGKIETEISNKSKVRSMTNRKSPNNNSKNDLKQSNRLMSFFRLDAMPMLNESQLAILSGGAHKSIGLAGLGSGVGTTTIAAKLAWNYSGSGLKTLLIDWNLDNADISKLLVNRQTPGLVDVILGDADPAETIERDISDSFDVMPLGKVHDYQTTPGVALAIKNNKQQLEEICKNYDVCLFDLPSLNLSSEASIVASLLDAVVLVAEYERTTVQELSEGVEKLDVTGANIVGVLLNRADRKRSSGFKHVQNWLSLRQAKAG